MSVPDAAGGVLLALARAAIEGPLGLATPDLAPDAAWLGEPASTFVTLTRGGALRGCIGSLEPTRRLRDDVAANAQAAAFHDPRFAPVRADEVSSLRIEVSLLSPAVPLPVASRDDALGRLRPGVDGVVLQWHGHRATFLPQVWRQLPDPDAFLQHLARKAGLPPKTWDGDVRLSVYTVRSWEEDGAGRQQP